MSWNEAITLTAPFISGAFGVGTMYGIMRGEVKLLKQQLQDMSIRVSKSEDKLDAGFVTYDRLDVKCTRCHTDFVKSIDEIKQSLKETRDKLPARLAEMINLKQKEK